MIVYPRETSPHQDSTGTAPSGTPPPAQSPPPPQTWKAQSHSAPTPLKRPMYLHNYIYTYPPRSPYLYKSALAPHASTPEASWSVRRVTICMYMYAGLSFYICIWVYISIYIHMVVYVCASIFLYMHMGRYLYVYTCGGIAMYTHMYAYLNLEVTVLLAREYRKRRPPRVRVNPMIVCVYIVI